MEITSTSVESINPFVAAFPLYKDNEWSGLFKKYLVTIKVFLRNNSIGGGRIGAPLYLIVLSVETTLLQEEILFSLGLNPYAKMTYPDATADIFAIGFWWVST